MPVQRNLEKNHIFVSSWHSGLYTQRSPIYTPLSSLGVQMIARMDTLCDGLNIELANTNTLVRRPGYPKYCSAAFGSSSYPLAFYSFKNLSGTIKLLVDTPNAVYQFTTTAITSVYTKGAAAQTSFQKVGNTLYMVNGTDAKKWDGTTLSGIGIATPVTAPTVSVVSSGSLSPTVGYTYVYVYKNSSTGTTSTASPISASTGPRTSDNFTIQGSSSADAQVDKVDIYRTDDGGSLYYFLAEVNNGGTWTYTDSTADSGLNDDIVAPTANSNDPIPSGSSLLVYHMGRLWTASGNSVYFSGGPDVTNGVGEEAWPPANVFAVPGAVKALISTSAGLLVSTSNDLYIIPGTSSATFYITLYQKNLGVQSQNCVAQDGDLFFIFTSGRQLFCFSDTLQEMGFAIGDKLTSFDPTTTSMTLHRYGSDSGLFVSDGSTNIYKFRMDQTAWSTVAQIVGGAGVVSSIETSAGVYTLLTGRTAGSGYILGRSTSTFNDAGTAYTAYATVGTLVVAPPGTTERLETILIERMPVGTDATVSVLLNEISGTFTVLPNPVPDPPLLPASTTIIAKRHYLKAAATALPQQVRHLQVKIAFAAEEYKNEILSLCIG